MKRNKRLKIIEIIQQHILNNKKEYLIVALLFIIGIFLGVFFINNSNEIQKNEINTYLTSFIDKMKNTENLDYGELLKISVGQNIFIAIVLWFFGTTVIGLPIVFSVVIYRGFCLGYTIAACSIILGFSKGLAFVLILLLLSNVIFIPAILALAVSGFKLYKSIIKDRNRDNIKLEILRHTIFSLIMFVFLIIAAFIEIFISTNILSAIIKYF